MSDVVRCVVEVIGGDDGGRWASEPLSLIGNSDGSSRAAVFDGGDIGDSIADLDDGDDDIVVRPIGDQDVFAKCLRIADIPDSPAHLSSGW